MTIDEAIKKLQEVTDAYPILRNPDLTEALRLGIEALDLVKQLQALPGRRESFRLPGETP